MNQIINSNRNYSVDLLKAISILYIVGFWHLFNYTDAFPQYYNDITSRLTVILLGLFTYLSGYLIGLKESFNNLNDVYLYYKKRIIRIYPLYLLAIILFFVLRISDFLILAKASVFLSMFITPAPLTLWFITMIFIFYIIAPLLVVIRQNILCYIATCISIYLILLAYQYYTNNLDFRFLTYFSSFALGIIIASKQEFFFSIKPLYSILILAGSILITFIEFDSQTITRLLRIPMVTAGSFTLFIIFHNMHKQIGLSLISIISYSSFCIYLFHRPVYEILTKLYFPENNNYQVIYLYFVCLPLIIIISWLIQSSYDLLNDKLNKNQRRQQLNP